MATGWTAEEYGFDSRKGQEIVFFSSVQTFTGAHPASYSMVKRPGRDTTQLHLVVRLRIRGALPPLQSRMLSLIKHRDNFIFKFNFLTLVTSQV
jgi:hypothetical protein